MCILVIFHAEAQGAECTAAVTDADSNRESNDRQRENYGVRGVAERTEIGGVRDEDLVDDVVERADKK